MDSESSRCDNREMLHNKTASASKLTYQHLKDITDNFSDERILGEGGFGIVYKGVLHSGEVIAVKRLMSQMPASQKQFENEVFHLMSLNHPNIVRCIGYCYETDITCLKHQGKHTFAETAERLLCLEYMPNGSLHEHLADENSGHDWHERYNIIIGICYGLHYIHKEWQVNTPIIHLDLKPANILLGDNLVPKIADFGMSRLFGEQQTREHTRNFDGTFGYMAPEYIDKGIITTKSDIFSLGVIIIEIITGNRGYPWPSVSGTANHEYVEHVLKNWRKRSDGASLEIDYKQIRSCLEVGLNCLQPNPEKRPVTTEIIKRLIGRVCTNYHAGGDGISSTLQATSDPREFLAINPHQLKFSLESNNPKCCLVKLTNNAATHVAFSFGVTVSRNKYIIEPTSGYLCPGSTLTVFVTLEEVLEYMHCNDEFLVRTIVVRDNSDDSFIMSSNVVHEANLTVAYVLPSMLCVETEKTKASEPHQSEGFTEQNNVDILIRCMCQDLGFSHCRPIAACIVYMCLLHWKSFEAGRTIVFDRIIANMFRATKSQDNNTLAYWLSNSSTLLLLMQRTLKTSAFGRFTPQRGKSFAVTVDTILMKNRAFGGKSELQQVEARRPALLFKGHLTGFVQKVYGMIRDNLVKEISALLECCTEAPTIICQALFDHWQSIVNILTDYLHALKSNYVPSFLISKMFTQIFSFIDVQLFNHLLLYGPCSLSYGEYIKAGLAKLEQWCIYEAEEYAGSSWEELKHIRKAAILLTMREKRKKTLKEITSQFCPVLSRPQLYRICAHYRDDRHDEQYVSPLAHVCSSMTSLLDRDEKNAVNKNVPLDDHSASCIPFTVDDILKSMTEFELGDVDMPPLIRENPCFSFLHQRKH